MTRHTQIACLVILGLIIAVNAKLELPSTKHKGFKDFTPRQVEATSSNDICDTPLSVGESTSYNVTTNITSGYLNIGTGTASALFYLFYKCRSLNSAVNPNSTADFTSVPVVVWLQGGNELVDSLRLT